MSYLDFSKPISFTSTYRPPTKEEDEQSIIELAKDISKLRWYQFDKRRQYLKRILVCAKRLRLIDKTLEKYMEEPLSHCCNAKRETSHADEGTACYLCSKCKKEFLTLDDMYHLSESESLKLETGD